MSNPIFYAADMSAAVFTMSLSEDANYPLSNLHTNLPTLFWGSPASTNNQKLNIDFGSAKACDFLALGSCNWGNMTNVELQYSESDQANFPDPRDALIINYGDIINWTPIVFPFTKVTRRYWRLQFTDCNSISPLCALLLLGEKMTMPFNYDMDAELGNKRFSTNVKESLGGTLRTSRQIAGRKRMEVSFTLIDDATVIAWQTMKDSIQGRLNPFFFKDHLDVIHILHFEEDYIPAKGKRANVNDLMRLKMCHQETG